MYLILKETAKEIIDWLPILVLTKTNTEASVTTHTADDGTMRER
jgi:hypothetical protein